MTKEQAEKLIRYYGLSGESGRYFCNDLFVELKDILPLTICFCDENLDDDKRYENLDKARGALNNFLSENPDHMSLVNKYCNTLCDIDLCEYLLEGYLFYSLVLSDRLGETDIFSNPRSICYLAFPLKAEW